VPGESTQRGIIRQSQLARVRLGRSGSLAARHGLWVARQGGARAETSRRVGALPVRKGAAPSLRLAATRHGVSVTAPARHERNGSRNV
jgi:hypothetical protein